MSPRELALRRPGSAMRLLLALIVCAGALAMTVTGLAQASTTFPNTALPVSANGEDINDPQVAVDPAGHAFYAWVREQPGAGTLKFIQAVRVSSTGTVGTVHTLSIATENASSPDVAASPDGSGIVVWQEFQSASSNRQVVSARILADGSLGTTLTLSNAAADATAPDVAIDSTGKALTVWAEITGDDTIDARTRSSADALGSIEDAASDTGMDANEPHVAMAANGDAVISLRADVGLGESIVFQRRSAAGTYSTAAIGHGVSGQSNDTHDQSQVAVDPTGDGDAVVTWREDTGANNQILARRIESNETIPSGQILTVSPGGQNADQPQVDMSGAGDAYLVWRRSNGTVTVPQFRLLASFNFLGGVTNLNPSGLLNADQPQVAVDAAGEATFAWRFGLNIEARGLTLAGDFTAIQPLTTTGSNTEPRVDANASGARWGAYRVDTAGNDRAFGFFDLPAPGDDGDPPDPPETPNTPDPVVPTPTPVNPVPPAPTQKKCKKGQRLKKGKCVKKKRRKKK